MTEDDLRELFEPFGTLKEVHLPLDDTRRSKGMGYIGFTLFDHALRAFADLDGTVFQGRLLHILPAKARPLTDDEIDLNNLSDEVLAGMTYKRRQELIRKAEASKADSWNTLFVRADTVANSIASKYGVSKGDIINNESGNAAVRLALAETHLLGETKKFLQAQGVVLERFEGSKKKCIRSQSVIIVKNTPFETEVSLFKLFA